MAEELLDYAKGEIMNKTNNHDMTTTTTKNHIRASQCVLFSCLASALLFYTAGCGRSTTVTNPEGEKTTIERNGDGVDISIKGKDGGDARFSSGQGVALPDDFPKDVAIYPAATVVMTINVDDGRQVTLSTEDAAEKVEAFYKDRLKKDGWEEKTSMNTPMMKMFAWEKDGRELVVNIMSEGGKTTISITVPTKS